MGLIRFLRGAKLLGQTNEIPGKSLVEHAHAANVDIPTNCTSGNCGSCMVTLLSGEVSLPNPLTPGLDEEIVDCLLYTSPSPRDQRGSRMPSSA